MPNSKKQKRNCPNPIWQNIKLSLLVSFISFKIIDQSETDLKCCKSQCKTIYHAGIHVKNHVLGYL